VLFPVGARCETLSGQQRISVLNEASAAFDRGKSIEQSDPTGAVEAFGEAAEKFQALIDSGVRNGRLYYDLANAELQRGRLGMAILNYRRAETLIPGDGRLQENLRFARSLCRNQIPPRGRSELLATLFFLHYQTSMRTRFVAAMACYAAFWGVLVLRLLVRRFRLGTAAVALAVVWIALGASVGVQRLVEDRRPAGVVTANDVVVRKGNGENYDPKFKQLLHEGVEFSLLEARGDWLYMELPDGNAGWIRSDQAELVRPRPAGKSES